MMNKHTLRYSSSTNGKQWSQPEDLALPSEYDFFQFDAIAVGNSLYMAAIVSEMGIRIIYGELIIQTDGELAWSNLIRNFSNLAPDKDKRISVATTGTKTIIGYVSDNKAMTKLNEDGDFWRPETPVYDFNPRKTKLCPAVSIVNDWLCILAADRDASTRIIYRYFESETHTWRAVLLVDTDLNTTRGFDAMKVIVRVSD
jgi:hypothetical protein